MSLKQNEKNQKESTFESSEVASQQGGPDTKTKESGSSDNLMMMKLIDSKVIDHQAMLRKFRQNLTIQSFSKSVLKNQDNFVGRTMILISNAQYLLRILVLHIILVSLHHLPLL